MLTQTLQHIYHEKDAISTLYRILKPGGVLLVTIPCISQNNDVAKRRVLARSLPASAGEAAATYLRQSATRYSYQGQAPPQNIFNPLAWADFIQAWKRGDFRNNN